MVVAEHLVRLVQEAHPSDTLSHRERVMHHRSKGTGKEVDFVVRQGRELLPIEVKYRGGVDRSDLGELFGLRRGLLITMDRFESYNGYVMLPAAAAQTLL